VPNASGRTRYSIDFRTVHLADAREGRGARLPEAVVSRYDDGMAALGDAIYERNAWIRQSSDKSLTATDLPSSVGRRDATGHGIIKSEDAGGASPCQHFFAGSNSFVSSGRDIQISATPMSYLRRGVL